MRFTRRGFAVFLIASRRSVRGNVYESGPRRGREPLLELRSRGARERDLAAPLVAREAATTVHDVLALVFGADREADEDVVLIELRDEVLERVPGRRVGPLHIVEDENERT